jgi:DNA polymerase elongation subunit (family B)
MSNSFYTNVQTVGNSILYRGIENGVRVKKKLNFKPSLYLPTKKATKFKTHFGEYVEEKKFDSIKDCEDFKRRYKEVENFKIYGDNRHEYSYIAEAHPGDVDWKLDHISIAYIDIEVGSEDGFPEPTEASQPITAITMFVNGKFYVYGCGAFDPTLCKELDRSVIDKIVYEECEDEEDLIRSFMNLWMSNTPDIVTGWNTNYFDFPYLINRMINLFPEEELYKRLSPWGIVKGRTVTLGKNKEVQLYDIYGVGMIDYIELYKKYSANPSQESYKLDYIGFVEVGTKKIDYSEYEDLFTLFKRNFQQFIEYNIRDVELVMKIEAKNQLLVLGMTLAYDAHVNYDDIFSQVRMWDTIILNDFKKKGLVMPPKKVTKKCQQFVGAYVKDPKPGKYKWVASYDFQALYPHLIMMYNLSPEMLIEPVNYDEELEKWFDDNRYKINVDNMLDKALDTSILKRKKLTLTPNGQVFRIDKQGFLSELMDRFYIDRAKFKKLMLEQKKELEKLIQEYRDKEPNPTRVNDKFKEAYESDPRYKQINDLITRYNNLQSTKKICLNSAYGAIGNEWFRFYDIRIAEAVTLSAQLSIIWIQRRLNALINKQIGAKNGDYVIASDTDSVYVTFKELIDKAFPKDVQKGMGPAKLIRALDKLCSEAIGPRIDKFCIELADYVNAYAQKLVMKREALADQAIWVKKKNYMINVYNNEGVEYAKPKLKIVGMAAIKSTTPEICRKKVKEAYELIINEDVNALLDYVDKFRTEFFNLPVQDIAAPTMMNGLEEYAGGEQIFKSKTPVHVKGALIYNHWLNELNLTKKYQEIKDGEKLKYVFLKEPNPIQFPVVSFTTVIPKEFGIDKYVDYPRMFQKTFMEQITRVTDVIGWNMTEESTLESLFGE